MSTAHPNHAQALTPEESGSQTTESRDTIQFIREALRLGFDLSALHLDKFVPRDGEEHPQNAAAPLPTQEVRRKALETLHLLDEYQRVKDKPTDETLGRGDKLLKGVKTLDEFLAALDAGAAQHDHTGENQTMDAGRTQLASRISQLLAEPQVYELLHSSLRREAGRFRSVQPLLSRLHSLRHAQDVAFGQIHALSLASKRQHGKIVGSVENTIGTFARLRREAEAEERRITEGASALGKGWIAAQRLLEYKRQLKVDRFVMTPSRRKLLDEIIPELGSEGRILLLGSFGTGKTELAQKALQIVSGGHHLVPWEERTTLEDVFGKKDFKVSNGEGGSFIRPGPQTRAIRAKDGQPAGVLHDELNRGSLRTIYGLKKFWNSKPGEEVDVPVIDQKERLPVNYAEVYTANPHDERVRDSEEFDAGITRVLGGVNIPFMSEQEQEQIILSKLIDENGVLHLSRSDVQAIRQLVQAAVMMQQCFDRAFGDIGNDAMKEIRNTTGISDLKLTKKFLDPGRLLKMFNTFEQKRAEGVSVADFLGIELKRFLAEFEVEEERNIVLAILKLKRVILADSTATSVRMQIAGQPDEKPYLLPSELGFLIAEGSELVDEDIDFDEDANVTVDEILATHGQRMVDRLNQQPSGGVEAAVRGPSATTEELKRAKNIMLERAGEEGHFFGPDEILRAFPGAPIALKDIPSLPPVEEIERHAKLKHTLRLRIAASPDGTKLTFQKINALLQPELDKTGEGKVLYSATDSWKLASAFFTDEVPTLSWAFTSDEVLPGSTDKNHLQQTELLADYAKNTLFKNGQMPDEFTQAIVELKEQKNEIQRLMDSDKGEEAAAMLAKLKINKLLRASPVEVLFDLFVTFFNSDPASRKRLLKTMLTWTATLGSDGLLVDLGYFDAWGVRVNGGGPRDSRGDLGVVLSREVPPNLAHLNA